MSKAEPKKPRKRTPCKYAVLRFTGTDDVDVEFRSEQSSLAKCDEWILAFGEDGERYLRATIYDWPGRVVTVKRTETRQLSMFKEQEEAEA